MQFIITHFVLWRPDMQFSHRNLSDANAYNIISIRRAAQATLFPLCVYVCDVGDNMIDHQMLWAESHLDILNFFPLLLFTYQKQHYSAS